MKTILISSFIFCSGTAFCQERIKIQEHSLQSMTFTSECAPSLNAPSIHKDQLFRLTIKINNEFYSKTYRSDDYGWDCSQMSDKKSSALDQALQIFQDVDDGNIQFLQNEGAAETFCKKPVITLLVNSTEHRIESVISSYKAVACPK